MYRLKKAKLLKKLQCTASRTCLINTDKQGFFKQFRLFQHMTLTQKMTKQKHCGNADKATCHLHPNVGMTSAASITSKHTPVAQKTCNGNTQCL